MDNEMIERVAKAMDLADNGVDVWDVKSEDGDGYGYLGKNDYRKMAKAAIKAMHEPTEKMIGTEIKHSSDPYASWTNMIDSITND